MNNHVAFGSFNLKVSRIADLADRYGHQLCPWDIHSGSDSPINHFSFNGIVFCGSPGRLYPQFRESRYGPTQQNQALIT